MTFEEMWFPPESCTSLGLLAKRTVRLEGDVIEVGSWEGRSTVHLAAAVWPSPVHAVDTWAGSPGEISEHLSGQRDVHATFLGNIAELTSGNVEVHRQNWRDYFEVRTGPIRFLFIDAEHSYREVADNIRTALPDLVAGGIICGDDAHHPPVIEAARDALGDVNLTAPLWWKEI